MSAADHLGQQWSVVHQGEHLYGGQFSTVHAPTGESVGYMRYRTGDDPFTTEAGHTSVDYIHVDPEHRGQGAAKALYRDVHAHTGQPFIHSREDMSPEAKKTVASSAAENPGMHRVVSFARGGFPRVPARAYPKRRQ